MSFEAKPRDVPFVSVVVPVRNGEADIADCVASLLRCAYPEARREIIVVDNGSSDRTAEIVRRYPIRCIAEARRGPSHARNRGIESSHGDIVAFTDADCVVGTTWLRELVRGFADSSVSGVAGAILSYPPETPVQRYMARRKVCWQKPAIESQGWPFAVTGNVAFRRETFSKVGLFDPLFLRGQDKDFGRRVFAAGLQLVYRPNAVVLHRHRRSTWGLFKQHAGWAYGSGLLHSKYGLPWRMRDEAGKYRELLAAVAALSMTAGRYALRRNDRAALSHATYDVVRRAALRLGTLQWAVHQLFAPVRFDER
jgi:glycosyltransferase involved in cell wall biosynthesis